MNEFSEYLQDYVRQNRLTWTKAAQLCGVERSLLQRYASGEKAPGHIGRVAQIAEGLQMTRQQADEWKIRYGLQKKGLYPYLVLRQIHRLFCGEEMGQGNIGAFAGAGAESVLGFGKKEDSLCQGGIAQGSVTKRMRGQEEICAGVLYLVQDVPSFCLKMDPVGEGDVLFPILAGIPADCRVWHIIEMNHAGGKEAEAAGFQKLLPFFLSKRDYQVYCHYQWQMEEAALEEGMHMVLSEKGVALFAKDMEHGVFSDQESCVAYYREIFQRSIKACRTYGFSQKSGRGKPEKSQETIKDREQEKVYKKICSGEGYAYIWKNLPGEDEKILIEGKGSVQFYIEEAALVGIFKDYIDLWKSHTYRCRYSEGGFIKVFQDFCEADEGNAQ